MNFVLRRETEEILEGMDEEKTMGKFLEFKIKLPTQLNSFEGFVRLIDINIRAIEDYIASNFTTLSIDRVSNSLAD